MKYIVTGGAGFIGSHIADALIGEGHEVVVIDDLATGKKENINPKADFHKIDVRDYQKIEPLFRGADGVFHLAALARIQPSFENPNLYFEVNAVGTRNVIMAASKNGARRIVYSASSSAYGSDLPMPLKESMSISSQALHPYGSTKRMGEMLIRDLCQSPIVEDKKRPEGVCLRYFNVYGPRQTTAADGPYATVIGILLDLWKNKKPLTIVPDGDQRRDFTWVGDVVRANLLAMRSENVGKGEILNIGCGKSYSIWDIAGFILQLPKAASQELVSSGKCVFAPPRRGEVKETLADNSLAKKIIGWQPEIDLEKGIELCREAL